MINDLISSTGLGRDVIIYHLDLSAFIDDFFSAAMEKGTSAMRMFGGTAINRAFFGKNQRFSLDMDLNYDGSMDSGAKELSVILKGAGYRAAKGEWMNSKHTVKRLIVMPTAGRIASFSIDLHAIKEEGDAQFQNLALRSITEFFGYPPMKTVVPSYTMERLLAGKLFALRDRTLDRDVYDAYVGLRLPPNYKLLRKYIEGYESFPQLVSVATHRLEKLMESGRRMGITRSIPEYCITDFNLMASEITRLLLRMV